MHPAQEVLKLITEANPKDTANLDAIDLAVAEYLRDYDLSGFAVGIIGCPVHIGFSSYNENGVGVTKPVKSSRFTFTRSRDVLKAIRPAGISYHMTHYGALTDTSFWKCEIAFPDGECLASSGAPTEELAELYVIIRALEYQRGNRT